MAKKPLLMVVEDEIDLADNISNLIKDTDRYDVATAYSAKEALACLAKNRKFFRPKSNRIRLIVLDIKMPEMDGLEFLAKLREKYPPEKIGVLILTAWEDKQKLEKARKGMVVRYLLKPFKSEDLISTIDRFFSGKGEWMVEQTKWDTLRREK